MRKKTELRTHQHPNPSRTRASDSGLIAKEENTTRSAKEEYVLDDRSHRTDKLRGTGPMLHRQQNA